MNIIKSIITLLEIFLFIFAIVSYFKRKYYSIPESWCFAIIVVLAFYSVTIQLFFWIGIIHIYYIVDIMVFIVSTHLLINNISVLKIFCEDSVSIFRSDKLLFTLYGIVYVYLFLQVLLLPPINVDSLVYNIARVMLMIKENSILLRNYTALHQVNFVWGYDILYYLFLRHYCDFFLSIFSYLCYTVIILSNYYIIINLSNNKKLAILISLVISSLPELVLQATSTKPDIGAAACTMVMFLSGYNIIFKNDKYSLLFLIAASLLGISFKSYFPAIAVPFLLLIIVSFVRKYSIKDLIELIKFDKNYYLAYLLIFSLMSFLLLFFYQNYTRYGTVLGEPQFVQYHRNGDGVKGAAINSIRYLVQMLEYPKELGGNRLNKLNDYLSKDNKHIGVRKGDSLDLTTRILPNEDFSWYGILGLALSLPAVLLSPFISSGYLRITAICLLTYFISICYFVAWMPWNGRVFSLFFAGSGVHIAYCFDRIFLKKKLGALIISISLVSLYFTALLNTSKPFINIYEIGYYINENIIMVGKFESKKKYGFTFPGPYIFNWTYFVMNRMEYYSSMIYQNNILEKYNQIIEKGAKVLLVAKNEPIFPFLIERKDIRIVVANPDKVYLDGKYLDIKKPDDFRILQKYFNYILSINEKKYDKLLRENSRLVYHVATGGDYNLYQISKKNIKTN